MAYIANCYNSMEKRLYVDAIALIFIFLEKCFILKLHNFSIVHSCYPCILYLAFTHSYLSFNLSTTLVTAKLLEYFSHSAPPPQVKYPPCCG